MIAKPNDHYHHDTLHDLLCDSLPADQAAQVESHLNQCESCRRELEQIAGDQHWWKETVSVLAESTLGPRGAPMPDPLPTSQTGPSDSRTLAASSGSISESMSDASLDWIRPLLEEPADSADMGRIDHYPVHSVIGQGGMGVVLRGTDLELNRPIAIKVLSPHLAGVGAARQRFMREAQAAAAVVHPSIVPIYGIAAHGRLPYIVMPCITGGNLQQRIEREGPLELSEVLRIGLQISEGLVAAHRQGVIHRDIKPANILLEEGNGRVLISDFGLARALDDATLTMSGMIAGTPQYMSPEQARGEVVDARSDLFSLGSLLYALATGRPPFRAESPLAVLRKISETRPRAVHDINERMPLWIDRLIAQLMHVDSSKRIPSAEDAAELIREALAHTRDPGRRPLPRNLRRSPRRVGFIAAATAILGPLLLVGASYWLRDTPVPIAKPNHSSANQASTNHLSVPQAAIDQPDLTADVGEWYGLDVESELTSVNQVIADLTYQISGEDENKVLHEQDSSKPIAPRSEDKDDN